MARATGGAVAAVLFAGALAGCGNARQTAGAGGRTVASTTCLRCHGGADNDTGAPPVSVAGQHDTTFPGVGAHTAHVTEGSLAGAYACTTCHPDPRSGSKVHQDGKVELTFDALATAGGKLAPAFDPATNRCSNVYCHGATLTGGANLTPQWTKVGQGEAGCGTCHGVPPPPPHPAVLEGAAGCQVCHAETIDATGTLIPASAGGKHLDGVVEATGGHEPSWMDPGSAGFHAFSANLGVATCQSCHGALLDGVGAATTVACASCHKPGGPGRDFATCTGCHGGADNASGAPPMATWGHAGDPNRGGGTLDAMRVGAHTVHLVGGPLAGPLGCDACHLAPTSIVDPGHIDNGFATLTFGTVASAYGAIPVFSRSAGTCSSTYCHGATIRQQELVPGSNPRGTNVAPVWTAGSSQAKCGTCHGLPPDTGMHFQHVVTGQFGFNLPCSWCHEGFTETSVTPSLHVNGTKDVILSSDSAVPGNAGLRITSGWDAAGCHSAVACHGMIY